MIWIGCQQPARHLYRNIMLFDISFPVCNYLITRNYGFIIEYKNELESAELAIYTSYISRKRGWVRVAEKVSVNDFSGFVDGWWLINRAR